MIKEPYQVYLNGMILPVTPGEIEEKAINKNKVVTLLNGEELNLIKTPGLTEFSFEARLPAFEYPSAFHADSSGFLAMIRELKESKEPFPFIVIRSLSTLPDSIHEMVTIEDMTVTESFKNAGDAMVKLKLKTYEPIKTKAYRVAGGKGAKVVVT